MDGCRTKQEMREYARNVRKAIPLQRRMEAREGFLSQLHSFDAYPFILSYESFDDEFDTHQINAHLEKEKRLLLPKAEKNGTMRIFHVTDRAQQLKKGTFGIMEPDPSLCEEFPISTIFLVLVPALAFDSRNHRLGYGKGYYDRFLPLVSPSTPLIGIGYKEQLLNNLFPINSNDVLLTVLNLT